MPAKFSDLSRRLKALLNVSPADAVELARKMDLNTPERLSLTGLQAAVLVDGGVLTQQKDAIDQGLALFRELYEQVPSGDIAYNLANALSAVVGPPPRNLNWLDHQERTVEQRAEARRLYWQAIRDSKGDPSLVTTAWTNLANQFSGSFRLGEAHDARLAALQVDPDNGVAACTAARELLWLFQQGGGSDLMRVEAVLLAKVAVRHYDRLVDYAGAQAARELKAFADQLGEPPPRAPHTDPFVTWVEQERLTLSPSVELVDPSLGKLDWLVLPGIMERELNTAATPPPIFAMFNVLKGDFILARDLAWRALDESVWPVTGRYADTLDFATYGPAGSALVLSHRTAVDLLDKVAVAANHYFQLGQSPDKVYFGTLWRGSPDKTGRIRPLAPSVEAAIRSGSHALYGLVELADDYQSKNGILRPQKDLRNAGTHRFVVLHDFGDPAHSRQAAEVEHLDSDQFTREVLRALRMARSSIQTFALAVAQQERGQQGRSEGLIGSLDVPDHDWIRGRDD